MQLVYDWIRMVTGVGLKLIFVIKTGGNLFILLLVCSKKFNHHKQFKLHVLYLILHYVSI